MKFPLNFSTKYRQRICLGVLRSRLTPGIASAVRCSALRSADGSEALRRPRSTTDVEGRQRTDDEDEKNCKKRRALWCAPIGSLRAVKRACYHIDASWLPSLVHSHVRHFAKPLESEIMRPTSKHADDSLSEDGALEPKLNNRGFPFSVSGFRLFVSVRSPFRRYKMTWCVTTSNDKLGPGTSSGAPGLLGGSTHKERNSVFKSLPGRGSAG